MTGILKIFQTLLPEQYTRILNFTKNGCTLLFLAVKQNKVEISSYLLQVSLRQDRRKMCETWKRSRHPLMAALGTNNPYLIELISISMWDINDYLFYPYTPLMLAICSGKIWLVRLLVNLGANTNFTTFYGCSLLMVSTLNSDICQFFVSMNLDLDHQDDYGDTALHIAVFGSYIESVKILVNAGANVRIRNVAGMTPLMLAIVTMNIPAIIYLYGNPGYSELDQKEAIKVFNACLVFNEQSVIRESVRVLGIKYSFVKNSFFPSQRTPDFSTRAELSRQRKNPLQLAIQGISVIERIFGRNNSIYLRVLLQTALIAKHGSNFQKVRQLIDNIEEYCQVNFLTFVPVCSSFFKILFNELAADHDPENIFKNGGFKIFKILAQSTGKNCFFQHRLLNTPYVNDRRYTQLVDILLYMAHIIRKKTLPEAYLPQFYQTVQKLVVEDPRVVNQQSLLHHAIKLHKTESWSSVPLIRLLLECGADVDAKDYFRRTPLMYALKHSLDDNNHEVVLLLLEYGCHLDCRDSEGFSAMESTIWTRLPIPRNPRSLQCHAAEVILDHKIHYEGELHDILKNFLSLHV